MMQQDLTYFHIIIIHYLIIYSLIEWEAALHRVIRLHITSITQLSGIIIFSSQHHIKRAFEALCMILIIPLTFFLILNNSRP